jgi:hypothetical protein
VGRKKPGDPGLLDAADDLDEGREAAEPDAVAVAQLATAVEADVLVVDERAVGGARVLDRDAARDEMVGSCSVMSMPSVCDRRPTARRVPARGQKSPLGFWP